MTSESQLPEPTEIAVAVVLCQGRALIGLRPAGVPLAGLWEFPGGKVLPGESPADAAARECREETGLAIRVDGLFCEVAHDYPHARLRLRFFTATPLKSNLSPIPPFRWIELARLADYQFPPANAEAIAKLSAIAGRPPAHGLDHSDRPNADG